MSIDIQVLADLAFILPILHILAILLQTKKKRAWPIKVRWTLLSYFLLSL